MWVPREPLRRRESQKVRTIRVPSLRFALKLRCSLDVKPLTSAVVVLSSKEGDDELKDGRVGLLPPIILSMHPSLCPILPNLVEASLPELFRARLFGRKLYIQHGGRK